MGMGPYIECLSSSRIPRLVALGVGKGWDGLGSGN